MIIQKTNGRWCTSWRTGGGRSEEPRTARLWEMRQRVPAPSRRDIKHEITHIHWPEKLVFRKYLFVCLFLSIWLAINGLNLLQVDNVAGAFLVLMIGMGLSVVTAVVEFFWVSRSALANQNVRYILWQTPNTAKTLTSPNCQFPSKIKRSSPDWQSEPFTEWSDVKLWSKRQKGFVHASRFLSQATSIFATCVDWKLN